MRKLASTLLIVVGMFFCVVGSIWPYVEAQLKADACSTSCVKNTECQQSSVEASCSCFSTTAGVTYSGNPTYASKEGSSNVSAKSVFCRATFSCHLDSVLSNHKCGLVLNGILPTFECVSGGNGSMCSEYSVGPAFNYFYQSCKDDGCNDE